MATHFNTDTSNQMGFYKFLMGKSDKMWARGKDMMKYITKRGGKMGAGFQVASRTSLGTSPVNKLSSSKTSNPQSFDPTTAHLLEEITEDYADEIRDMSGKLNTLARMMRQDKSKSLALHMFDNM